MYKNATKCNETFGKWCKNKHGASKIIDTFETYQQAISKRRRSISPQGSTQSKVTSLSQQSSAQKQQATISIAITKTARWNPKIAIRK
jgi:hypothetical protein